MINIIQISKIDSSLFLNVMGLITIKFSLTTVVKMAGNIIPQVFLFCNRNEKLWSFLGNSSAESVLSWLIRWLYCYYYDCSQTGLGITQKWSSQSGSDAQSKTQKIKKINLLIWFWAIELQLCSSAFLCDIRLNDENSKKVGRRKLIVPY